MGTRRRELISGDLSSVGSTVLAQIEIDLRIVASGRGEFLKVLIASMLNRSMQQHTAVRCPVGGFKKAFKKAYTTGRLD